MEHGTVMGKHSAPPSGPCPFCKGSGKSDDGQRACGVCHGSGQV